MKKRSLILPILLSVSMLAAGCGTVQNSGTTSTEVSTETEASDFAEEEQVATEESEAEDENLALIREADRDFFDTAKRETVTTTTTTLENGSTKERSEKVYYDTESRIIWSHFNSDTTGSAS